MELVWAKVRSGEGATIKERSDISLARDTCKQAGAAQRVYLALLNQELAKAEEDFEGELAGRVDAARLETTVTKEKVIGSAVRLVPGAEERRYIYASSGVLYAPQLDDMLAPVMVSICPWGCANGSNLSTDRKSLAIDLGVWAATYGSANKKVSSDLSFLLGLSWDFNLFRASAGAIVFENTYTDNINLSYYAGLTIDAVNFSRVFGLLGLSVPVLPEK